MVFVWSGFGFVLVPIVIVGPLSLAPSCSSHSGLRLPLMIAVLGTLLAFFGFGLFLHHSRPVGYTRGGRYTLTQDHSLYCIPVKCWSAITLVSGTIFVFKK